MTMNDEQVNFYRALFAPFPDSCLSTTRRGGRDLTYIDSRTLANRLDSVCGPHGWRIKYRPTKRGYLARMGILCPVESGNHVNGGTRWAWVWKEDGAGFEEMGATNKTTGEFEYDVDNDEKSAYTNAFRRVAQNAWGIARYLYNKGIPDFLDPNAGPATVNTCPGAKSPATATVGNPAPAPTSAPAPRPSAAPQSAPPPAAAPKPAGPGQYNNFAIPKPGKAVFAWAKKNEEHFQTALVNGLKNDGKRFGYGDMMSEWTQEQVNECCMAAIRHIMSLDNYQGEYNHLETPTGAAPALPAPTPVAAAPAAGLATARTECSTALTASLTASLGRKPTIAELKSSVAELSAEANGGEVMASIGACEDVATLKRFTKFLIDLHAKNQAAVQAADPEIPF